MEEEINKHGAIQKDSVEHSMCAVSIAYLLFSIYLGLTGFLRLFDKLPDSNEIYITEESVVTLLFTNFL